jgi:hypothetical protein
VYDDAWHTLTAVWCTLRDMTPLDLIDYVIRDQIFVGPEGACVGSELHFAVSLQRS